MFTRGVLLALALAVLPACDYEPVSTTCRQDGTCWAYHESWEAQAQATTSAKLQSLVNQGQLAADNTRTEGDACWDIVGTSLHVCVVYIGGALLYGRPTSEVLLGAPGQYCPQSGAWSYNRLGYGKCWGVMDSVAFQLDSGWCCTSLAPDEVCYSAEVYGECTDGTWCPSGNGGVPACE